MNLVYWKEISKKQQMFRQSNIDQSATKREGTNMGKGDH
jgi:hypothetical protein